MLGRGYGLNQRGLPDLSSAEQAHSSCLRKAIDDQRPDVSLD
jgi:hypothetical protein